MSISSCAFVRPGSVLCQHKHHKCLLPLSVVVTAQTQVFMPDALVQAAVELHLMLGQRCQMGILINWRDV